MADRRYTSPHKSSTAQRTDNDSTANATTTTSTHGQLLSPPAVLSSWRSLTKNPYNTVRGRNPINHKRQSITAVRSFLALVPVEEEDDDDDESYMNAATTATLDDMAGGLLVDEDEEAAAATTTAHLLTPLPAAPQPQRSFGDQSATTHSYTTTNNNNNNHHHRRPAASKDETASQVAEGTLRALRDLALEEALELNTALRYWSHRWERPLLSWLEAGPSVWTSATGYRHRHVGERVAQLQAVLARRCAAIGELQTHLLRAGWQQGVAQWGVLDQFQTVSGVDGSIRDDDKGTLLRRQTPETTSDLRQLSITRQAKNHISKVTDPHSDYPLSPSPPPPPLTSPVPLSQQSLDDSHHPGVMSTSSTSSTNRGFRRSSSHVGGGKADVIGTPSAHVLVHKGDGEGLYTDHPDFVAEWTVDAITLVRRHLYRASNGLVKLPYQDKWMSTSPDGHEGDARSLPSWVTRVRRKTATTTSSLDEDDARNEDEAQLILKVSDLNLMLMEVSELLNVMEDIMLMQRQRRLERMQAPGWLRRNWYVVSTIGPLALWLAYKGHTKSIVSNAFAHIRQLIKDRLTDPFMAM